jgi:hypothetical protein
MHDAVLQSGLANFLVAVPFVGLLMAALFRLDEIIATPKRARAVKRRVCGRDENGRLLLSDPDGRPWDAPPKPGKARTSDQVTRKGHFCGTIVCRHLHAGAREMRRTGNAVKS